MLLHNMELSYMYRCLVVIRLTAISDHIMQLLPSYEVNIQSYQFESGRFPEGCSPMETTFQWLTTCCSPHMEAITVL